MAENYFTGPIAAEEYASLWPHLYERRMVDPPVDFLAGLARGGPALELGVGTGRLALPSAPAAWPCTASSCRLRWWSS